MRPRVQNEKTKLKSQVCDGIDGEALATGSFPRWGFDRGPRSPVPPGHPGHPPDPPSQDPPSKPPHTPHDPPSNIPHLSCPLCRGIAALHFSAMVVEGVDAKCGHLGRWLVVFCCGFASVANIYNTSADLKAHHGAECEANMVMIVVGAINVQFNFHRTHVGTRWVRSHKRRRWPQLVQTRGRM